MSRETIIKTVFDLLKAQKSVKFGRVSRDPIIPEELAKISFPAAYITTTNEEITDITFSKVRQGVMDCEITLFVGGANRDTQRNVAVEAVEKTLMADRTLDGTAEDCMLTSVETITAGEGKPYASYRIVFAIQHCYTL